MMNSRSLDDLDPRARPVCNEHLQLCKAAGIELIVTSTWRDYESQDVLYAIGRNGDPRRIVTNARAGHSWHNFKCAWDVVPVILGKPVWEENNPIWKQVIEFGKQAGAEAGAEWKTFKDMPHFQVVPLSMTIEMAKQKFDAAGTIFA